MCTDRYTFYACGCRQGAEQPYKVCDFARVNENLTDTQAKRYRENEMRCEECHKVEKVALPGMCNDCEPKAIKRRVSDNKRVAGSNYGLTNIKE